MFEALPEVPEERAASLIHALEQRRAALSGRERKEAAIKDKQVLALFLSPAALRFGGKAVVFAESLCAQWNAQYPRNRFYTGNYVTIMKGFDANLLGLPLRKSKNRR